MQTAPLEYRPARLRDLDGVVQLFRRVQGDSIWATLGPQTTRVYFDFYVARPREALIVAATAADQIVGFCLGTGRPEQLPAAFYEEQLFELMLAMAREPGGSFGALGPLVRRMARAGSLAGEHGASSATGESPGCWLSTFAVAPEWRGHGVGTRLVESFADEMQQRGFAWCEAHTTVGNIPSQAAQTRAGFVLARSAGPDLIFRRTFSPPPNGPPVSLETTIVSRPADIAALAESHFKLWSTTPEASAFETMEWTMASWRHQMIPGRPAVIVSRLAAEPVAMFPMCLHSNGLLSAPASRLGNYGGPVYDPRFASAASRAWRAAIDEWEQVRAVDVQGLRGRSPFLREVVALPFRRFGLPAVSATNICPEMDLSSGWTALLGRRSPKQRSTWRRRWARLHQQGELRFRELTDPPEILSMYPRLQALYSERWRGRRITAAFSREQEPFQRASIEALGRRGLARLSVLELDGKIIAFSYGLRGRGVTTSYVLAHDARLGRFSPGSLLLLRVLEAAAQRGDVRYDFSLGEEPYKASWATQEQRVYSLSWGPGSRFKAAGRRAWTAARGVELLRRLKQGGPP